MAITTYAELQAAVAAWLVRRDLAPRIPEFITLAESRLNRVLRMRRAEGEVSLTGTVNSRTIPLPTAYTEALACWITIPGSAERTELKFVDPVALTVFTAASRPYAWTIDGVNLAFERPLDQPYPVALRYLAKFQLSDGAPTNALLADYPDVYLFATLCEAGPFLRDADLTSAYESKLRLALAEVNAKDARSRGQQRLPTEVGQLQRLSGSRSGYSIYRDR